MKIALAQIVKGTDEEAEALARSLLFNAKHVDGIFITITHLPGESVNEKVKAVAEDYGAVVSTFEWCNDFSKARNFNFSQVPKEFEYIVWCDADDAIRDLDKLEATIEKNPADVYTFFYMYAFDEQKNPTVVHIKTQVVKNDGCVYWIGKLHEDFKETRTVTRFHIDGIERLHLSNEKRFEGAKQRNLEIALEYLKDAPNDPHTYWIVANAYKAMDEKYDALKAYEKFLETSKSEDEKYIARCRIAEVLWLLNKKTEAIVHLQTAIGIKPNFPDAYFLLGSLYFETQQYQKAEEMFLTGLPKPRPYHSIMVYNPRDYDYTPMMNLAKTYFALARPDMAITLLEACHKIYPDDKNLTELIKSMKKEVKKFDEVVTLLVKLSKIKDKKKLKAEFDKIPDELKAHPGVCNFRNINFLKETSTGKDLIVYCGFTDEQWTPETIKAKGIGGSEEAVFHLSNKFANAGYNVTVYNNCGHEEKWFLNSNAVGAPTIPNSEAITLVDDKSTYMGYVSYKPFWMWNYRDKQDVVIIWRTPLYCDYEINAPKVYVDMHDVIPAGEFTPTRLERITKVFVKSKFQRELFPQIPDEKILIIPNGIVLEKFNGIAERNDKLVINTSAPNRGIAVLTEMWKDIKKEVPDARLKWAYGWGTFDSGFRDDTKVMEWKAELIKKMEENGVEAVGRLNHDEVAKLYMEANIWAYPSGFGEIDCISLSKAMAAGALPVTTDFAALNEKKGHGGIFSHSELTSEDWAKPYQFDFSCTDEKQIEEMKQGIIKFLKSPPSEEQRQSMREWAQKTYAWDSIATKWLEVLNED